VLTDLLTDISFYKEHIKSRVEGQKPPVAPLEARYQKKGEGDFVENNSRGRDFSPKYKTYQLFLGRHRMAGDGIV